MSNTQSAPRQARFGDLNRIENELFANNRLARRRARLSQIVQGTLKKIGFGQHRQTIGARMVVGCGLRGGVEIRRDQTFGGRGLFDFGDESQTVGMAQ